MSEENKDFSKELTTINWNFFDYEYVDKTYNTFGKGRTTIDYLCNYLDIITNVIKSNELNDSERIEIYSVSSIIYRFRLDLRYLKNELNKNLEHENNYRLIEKYFFAFDFKRSDNLHNDIIQLKNEVIKFMNKYSLSIQKVFEKDIIVLTV